MKIKAYSTDVVEVECDITTDEICNEFSRRVDEAEETYFRRLLPALDCITRAMARIDVSVIAAIPFEARKELHKRLQDETYRWSKK